jgi:hypothetical protein
MYGWIKAVVVMCCFTFYMEIMDFFTQVILYEYLKFVNFILMIYLVPEHWYSFRCKSTYADQHAPTTIRKFQVSIFAICSFNFDIMGFEYKFCFHD